jgi:ferric-dicitrate binding protein FerR (iron transport regulator)
MNLNKTKLRALLDDVLPASGEHHGPSRAHVLEMLHCERARRRRWHAGTALVAITALMVLLLLWKNNQSSSTSVANAAKKPAPITIEHVNDEQLLALLHGTPAALMEWPNGDRTLLLVVKH